MHDVPLPVGPFPQGMRLPAARPGPVGPGPS